MDAFWKERNFTINRIFFSVDSAEFKFHAKSMIQLNSVIGIFTLESEILCYFLFKPSYRE